MIQPVNSATDRPNTDRPNQARQSAEEKPDRLREDLTAMVYHDIRSPLSNIVSSLEVLSSLPACAQDATAQSMVEIAQRSAERIQRLIDTLLDIDRLEAGQIITSRRPASMRTLIQQAKNLVLPTARVKGLKISTHLSAHLPPVYVDEEMILRVLLNLLENAVKFTTGQGKIQITVKQQGEMLLTSIKDSGPGIAPSNHQRIFEKYTRLNTLDNGRGLGLGLAYCRLAVEGHGGQIWVESEPGAGAQFKFTLPIAQGN